MWRDFLARAGGRRSLREMTGPQLGRVLDALHAAGAPKVKGGGAGRPRFPDTPQVRKIRALWLALAAAGAVRDRGEAAMAAFVKRQTGQEMGALGADDANRAIEALKAWLDRVQEARES